MIAIGLDEYIEGVLKRSFEWGQLDCCTFGADWIIARRGVDPMGGHRGTYQTQAGAVRLYTRHGGFVSFVGGSIDDAGLKRTDEPETGDVGIVTVPFTAEDGRQVLGPVLAIRFATRWMALGTEGIFGGDFPTRLAWRV